MRLERLEIAGFKSFSDRAEVSFDRGVTAIVGPNGCGKSNLADALTWVLGEQSAKSLRGEKMEDVIFNGSDARKPTGAAEVRLRLSDVPVPPSMLPEGESTGEPSPVDDPGADGEPLAADAATNGHAGLAAHLHANGNGHKVDLLGAVREVEVTRRLYRSGESEYLIDGHICRLKDIHELLMDTGLGAKAYSIIEQGKIGMILSSRPTDRRQLIEEAAGITKYKARRRAAELKLEAAQQNLTRIDDIVFEVEKQRGSLKRQAAKARRYTRLRDEMRRWEKVLFARRYRALGEAIESARTRLEEARTEEATASGRLAAVESELAGLRIALAEAEAAATRVREAAHTRELEIGRRQQQIALDTQQAEMLKQRGAELDAELRQLETRREPDRLAIEERRTAVIDAERARDEAAATAAAAAEETSVAQREVEAAEQDVETVRSDVFALMNTMTALRTGIESARAQRERAAEGLARLDVEAADLRTEHERALASRRAADEALQGFRVSLESARTARVARETELAAARTEHEWRSRELRRREHELASLAARLRSLEELDASRAGFSDAARMILAQANGKVGQLGAVADFLEVEPRYERAVEACLGDLLQHVLVEHHDHVSAGLALVRQEDAGRCGFVVITDRARTNFASVESVTGAVSLSSVAHFSGRYAAELRGAVGDALIADSFETAVRLAGEVSVPVATLDGDVFRGPHIVVGGGKAESRGILATKREIKELRDRLDTEHVEVKQFADETSAIEQAIALAVAAVAALSADLHRHEKDIVGADAQLARARADEARLEQRTALVAQETRRVQDEMQALDARQTEAAESIAKLDEEKREKDATFAERQRALGERREAVEALSQKAAEARAAHAGLIERAASAAAEVLRLEEAARELERRVESCARDARLMHEQRERLIAAAAESQSLMDADVTALDTLRVEMREADDKAQTLKDSTDRQENIIRDARRAVDAVRALAAELDVTRATAESDLNHLAQQCVDAVAASLDEVNAEVAQMEAAGAIEPDIRAIRAAEAPEPDEEALDDASDAIDGRGGALAPPAEPLAPASDAEPVRMTAEEAIAELKGKIDKLGPVNMMAIEQFDELETRHTFLTTQRKDLVDSIAQTNEAIRRIDETTHARFREAFTAIAANFQVTFSTLFGGGRAGLTLLDENDPLESGIDIVASPPGKRLQNVQLLSGGEKALTAISLMFAIFRYKPSPFCLLDEIDAPLDDANIGRFVEMLRGMLARTQFIIITHNRKTMEIANRLYGVTMEEPGVSKLISMQLN
jgi:chromosome segregation protein